MAIDTCITQRPVKGTLLSDIPEWLARIYAARDIKSWRDLDYRLENLSRPNLLNGLEEALDILQEALIAEAKILFIGDFDADGATSCALGVHALKAMGAHDVGYLVPNRFDFGYGLSPEIVGVAAAQQPDVIITVDNGIASHEGVLAANELGITTIITDHHLPANTLPNADAIVNPNCKGDRFPSKNLAGVGVIFYVMMALRSCLRDSGWFKDHNIVEPNLANYLDLVALGTIADMVTLDHNNRILISQGLNRMRSGNARPGIQALLEVANKDINHLSASDLGFSVAPKLNAAGRLEDITIGIECLLTEDLDYARHLASQLNDTNRRRQELQVEMMSQANEAVKQLRSDKLPSGITLMDSNWHQGLVGLIAGRVAEQTHRPTIAFAPGSKGELKGSARSINGVHIRDLLALMDTQNPNIIDRFGGHAMAAGLSLGVNQYETFKNLFDQYVEHYAKNILQQGRVTYTDGGLTENEINLENARLLNSHGPWGQGFPEPLFNDIFEVIHESSVGPGYRKLRLRKPDGKKMIEGIQFKVDDLDLQLTGKNIQVVYRLDINDYAGRLSAQLIIENISEITTY